MKNLIHLLLLVISVRSVSAQNTQDEDWDKFIKSQKPITKVTSPYDAFRTDEEEELDTEIAFQKKRCKFESIKTITDILAHFSKVDSLLALKSCTKKGKGLEEQIKQQIFLLSKFPKLEILPMDKNDEKMNELTKRLSILWEERVYLFSNFYHGQTLLWLGEEKEISEEINRIIYTDMSEKRKMSLLKKITDDLLATNKRIYHLYQYSNQNLFHAGNLEEENQKSKEILQNFFTLLSDEENITAQMRENLIAFNGCIGEVDVKNPDLRLSALIGFWQDYEFLGNTRKQVYTKESLSIMKFLKKNIIHSHHFERRLEKGLNVCRLLTQSK